MLMIYKRTKPHNVSYARKERFIEVSHDTAFDTNSRSQSIPSFGKENTIPVHIFHHQFLNSSHTLDNRRRQSGRFKGGPRFLSDSRHKTPFCGELDQNLNQPIFASFRDVYLIFSANES